MFRAGLILIAVAAQTAMAAPANRCAEFTNAVNAGKTPAQKLNKFLDAQWKYFMTEFPEWATYVGYPGQNNRWSDVSPAGIERQTEEMRCQLAALKKISKPALKGEDRVNYDLALYQVERELEGRKFPGEYMPVNQMGGIQIDAVQMFQSMPTSSVKDYEDILARLEKFPLLAKQTQETMREGLKRKVTPVKEFMLKVNTQVNELVTANVDQSPLFAPFKEFAPSIPKDEQPKLQARARDIIAQKIYPALREFSTFLTKDYIPNAREFIAFTEMPDGKAWYAYMVKRHTTTDKTPDELHELGLREVQRLTAEMNKIREQVKFKGDLKAFNKFLLTDKQFFFTSAEALLAGYRDIAKRVDAELPRLFKTLPRLPYGVRAIAAHAAPAAAGAQYMGGSLEAGRAGYFEANTYDLPSRPKWDMETLTFHEAVPGHHFQIATAQEIQGLPEFRKHGGFTAYSEGWALYAESLGDELGFFKDPYSKYGNLSAEMMRAVRLVVDTGMHAKGWSKQKALEFYRNAMPISDVESETEINRYISWPGQALAYKVGQLKFRELREESRVALGDGFDVREFHDEVLKHGALPMDVLEKTVHEWVASKKKKSTNVRHI